MNIYKIVTLSHGVVRELILPAYDAVQAIQASGENPNEVVRLELIGSTVVNDITV